MARCWRIVAGGLIVAICAQLAPSNAKAQATNLPALVMVPNVGKKNQRNLVMQALREEVFPVELTRADFDGYFWEYELPRFVQAANLNGLPSLRREFKQYFSMGKTGPVHSHLNDLVIGWAMKVIQHPNLALAFKYNATLMVAELNVKELDPLSKAPPVPYQPALTVLLPVVKAPAVSDALKVAALIGIERQAEGHRTIPLNAETLAEVTTQMLALVQQQKPPQGRNQPGHDWMRRIAAQALGSLGDPGQKLEVLTALEATMSDPNTVLSLRCACAQAIGELKLQGAKPDFARLVGNFGQLTTHAVEHHLGAFKQRTDYPLRRSLKACLYNIHLGLAGPDEKSGVIQAAAASPQKDAAGPVAAKMEAIWKAFDNDKLDDTQLVSEMENKLSELKRTLTQQPTSPKGLAADGATASAAATDRK